MDNEKEIQELEVTEVGTIEDQISTEIKRFNLADAAIAQLKQEYGSLEINGLEDKEGYEAVRIALGVVKSKRTGIEKKRKSIKEDYLEIAKGIDGEAKRLTSLLQPLEDQLQSKKDAIDDAREKEKKDKENAERLELDRRLALLFQAGIQFDGIFYRINKINLDIANIRALSTERFDELLGYVKDEKAKNDEEERVRKEAEENQRLELQKKQEQLDAERKKLDEEQQLIQKQKEALRKQKAELFFERFMSLGFTLKPGELLQFWGEDGDSFNLRLEELFQKENDEIEKVYQDAKKYVEETVKKRDEKRLLAEKLKNRLIMLEKIQLVYDTVKEVYVFRNSAGIIQITLAEIRALDDEQWGTRINSLQSRIEELRIYQTKIDEQSKLKEERDKKDQAAKAELARQASLADIEKIKEFIANVQKISVPVSFADKDIRAKFIQFLKDFDKLLQQWN